MVTGCAPFFLLGLAGVAAGSWLFGSHAGARLFGLGLLAVFLLYFALLNWTAQTRLRRNPDEGSGAAAPGDAEGEGKLSGEDRAEWLNYLRTEGRILWAGTLFLIVALLILAWRS